MDFSKIPSITITHLNLQDLLNKRTGNVMAEAEVPEMLRQAIKAGTKVIITDPLERESCRLLMNEKGDFFYGPLA